MIERIARGDGGLRCAGLILLIAAAGATAPGAAHAASVAREFRVQAFSDETVHRGHRAVLVRYIAVSFISGKLRISCRGCIRRRGDVRVVKRGRRREYHGLNWIVSRGQVVRITTVKSRSLGRSVEMTPNRDLTRLAVKDVGCVDPSRSPQPCPQLTQFPLYSDFFQACTLPYRQSTGTGTAGTIHFENRSNRSVRLYWLNFQGTPILYGKVKPYTTFVQPTYRGHLWALQRASGACAGSVLADGSDQTYVIGAA